MSPSPDFVDVQLSAAGKLAVGDAPLRSANAHFHYEFTATKPVRVLVSEWKSLLSLIERDGAPLLEIAPALAPTTKSSKQTTAQPEEAGA